MKKLWNNYRKQTIAIMLVLVFFATLGLINICKLNQANAVKGMEIPMAKCNLNGYSYNEGAYVNQVGDANIQLPKLNCNVNNLTVKFSKPIEKEMSVTVYYADEGHGYSESYTSCKNLHVGDNAVTLPIMADITTCRIDIGTVAGENFAIDSIMINDEMIKTEYYKVILLSLIFMILSLLIYFTCIFKWSAHRTFAVLALVVGVFYIFAITPLSVPDEKHHYQSAYKLSNYMLFQWENADKGDVADLDYANFTPHKNSEDGYERIFEELFDASERTGEKIDIPKPYGLNYFVEYIPQAIGIVIARILNINFVGTFLLGRFFNLLFYVLCLYWTIKITPKFKLLFGVIGVLPMTMHQAASYSYDAFINGIAFILIASILRAICEKGVISKKELGVIIVSGALLAPTKIVYVVLLLPCLLIPKTRFESNGKLWTYMILVLGVSIIAMLLFNMDRILIRAGSEASMTVGWEGKEYYSLSYVFENPVQTLKMFVETLKTCVWGWFLCSIGKSLSGLSLQIPNVIINSFVVICMLSALSKAEDDETVTGKMRTSFIATSVIVILLTMLSMMLGWTSVGRQIIQGVQGRYFIPVLPLLFMSVNNKTVKLNKSINTPCTISCIVLHCYTLYSIINYTV